jgi:hypothetical protein
MDVYMTDGQVCYRCHFAGWVNSQQLMLQDAYQRQYVVAPRQILGVQKHPILAKLFLTSIRNQGVDELPGRIIVPQAFTDEKQPPLKYSSGLPATGR